jgi:DNA-binding transcriptional ArsR family regulator
MAELSSRTGSTAAMGAEERGRSMPGSAEPIDHLFRALSDPTRRQVVERLSRSPATVSELAAPFAMALPSFVQHLAVLERSGLVHSRKSGRVRTYQLISERLLLAEDWLAQQRRLWERRLDQLDAYLIDLKEQRDDAQPPGDPRSDA